MGDGGKNRKWIKTNKDGNPEKRDKKTNEDPIRKGEWKEESKVERKGVEK